jgi:hypothetical protein
MIKKLAVKGLKGLNAEVTLGKKNVIVGDNFIGKTAVLDAIRLVYLGGIPQEDKMLDKAAAIHKSYASGPLLEVRMLDADNKRYGFRAALSGSGIQTSSRFKASGDAAMEFLLNPTSYFDKTGPKRINAICQMLGDPKSSTPDALISKLESVEAEGEIGAAIRTQYIREIRPKLAKAVQEAPVLIEIVDTYLAEAKRGADAVVKRMAATTAGLVDLQALDTESAGLPTIEEVNVELKEAQEEIDTINGSLGGLDGIEREHALRQQSIDQLTDSMGTDWGAKIKDAEGVRDTATTLADQLRERIADLATKLTPLQAREEELKNQADALDIEASEIMDRHNSEGDWVPFTPSSLKDCETEVKATVTFGPDGLPVAWAISHYLEKAAVTPEELERAKALQLEAATHLETINSEIDPAIRDITAQHDDLVEELGACGSKVEASNLNLAAYREAMTKNEAWSKTLDDLKAAPVVDVVTQRAQLKTRRDALHSKKLEFHSLVEKIGGIAQDRKRIEDSKSEGAKIQVEIAVNKAMAAKIKELKKSLIDDSVGAAVAVANKFGAGILKTPLVYHDGVLGRLQDGTFIELQTFSGAELTLATAAFGVALASKSKEKIAIIDELSVFDDDRKAALIKNLGSLVDEGVIDQFICVDNRPPVGKLEKGMVVKIKPLTDEKGMDFDEFLKEI